MKTILIDTDCGIDDAGAIMLALSSPEVRVAAVTTVAGNVGLDHVNRNVLGLLSYFKKESIPVYAGSYGALLEKPLRAQDVHGSNGLGDVELPKTDKKPEKANALQGMYETARANPGMTFVTLGPLTNLAMALMVYPDLPEYVSEVVVMGGAIDRGNVTKFAEFNFAADPEAVQAVFNSPLSLTIVPWDTCLPLFVTEDELNNEGFAGTRAGKLFMEIQQATFSFVNRAYGKRAAALPDPAAMACAVKPELASSVKRGNLRMELSHTTLRGASIPVEGFRLNIITEINRKGFIDLLKRIKSL